MLKRIPCPWCVASDELQPMPQHLCNVCKGTGTIPDRREPTANDRAIAEIKNYAEQRCIVWHPTAGPEVEQEMKCILAIISEEQEREG